MHVLVLNCGSSSVKYQLFDMAAESVLAWGLVERIGEPESRAALQVRGADGDAAREVTDDPVPDHAEALERILDALERAGLGGDLVGVGHRVVHGGETFVAPTVIDGQVIAGIKAQVPLAPLHNPANLLGIEVAMAALPEVRQVAVFDTAFHQSLPPRAYRYALPASLYTDYGVRRYGFHGTSHAYVARRAAEHLGRPLEACNLITAHLGNGASVTAIEGGRSVDTSMGLSPLEGLVMGTRSGDLDPAVVFHLMREAGLSADEVERLLNRESGLKGLCGANDLRHIEQRARDGDADATLALEVFCHRLRKYLGAYAAVLGRVDALVFTAGIGENSPTVRAEACRGLAGFGVTLDPGRNDRRADGELLAVHAEGSAVAVLVVPTDEELEIAEQTLACVQG